jgi:hypothetical protein
MGRLRIERKSGQAVNGVEKVAKRKTKKRTAKPESVRAVLRYLRERPWSTTGDIAFGIRANEQTVRAIIRNELSLRTEQRAAAGGGPAATLYALPEVPRWYWIWKAKHQKQAAMEQAAIKQGVLC